MDGRNGSKAYDEGLIIAKKFMAGAAGGGIDSMFTMPLDTIKTQMQLNRDMGASTIGCIRKIFVTDGIRGFYKGYVPFGIMAAGKASVRWGTFGVFTSMVDSLGFDRTQNKTFWTISCGLGAGTFEALIWTAPNERLKVLRQVSAGQGTYMPLYHEIFALHGFKGLWVGAMPTAMRSATNAAIRFSVAGYTKPFYCKLFGVPEDGRKPPMYVSFMAGGTGGAISVVINNPIDVVKTQVQAGYKGGIVSCCRDIVRERGFIAFSAGLTARVPQIFLSQAIQFCVIDTLYDLMGVRPI